MDSQPNAESDLQQVADQRKLLARTLVEQLGPDAPKKTIISTLAKIGNRARCNDDDGEEEYAFKEQFASDGGIDAILKAMTNHQNVACVQEWACWTLEILTRCRKSGKLILQEGGPNAIISAMKIHCDLQYVQERACMALHTLAFFTTEILETATVIDGVEETIELVMLKYRDNNNIQYHGKEALGYLKKAPSERTDRAVMQETENQGPNVLRQPKQEKETSTHDPKHSTIFSNNRNASGLIKEEEYEATVFDHDLTGANFKKNALESLIQTEASRKMLSRLIFTKPTLDSGTQPSTDCFLSHRGPDTKKQLLEPLKKTLQVLYNIDCFVDSLPLNEYKNEDKVDTLRKALWTCPRMVIFLSKRFHKSKYCLKELYTALYRATVDPAFIYHIVFCRGMDPRQCKALEEYQDLDLGRTWGTLETWNLPTEEFVVQHLHKLLVRLVLGEASIFKDDSEVRSVFDRECTVREPVFQYGVPPPLDYFEGREEELQILTDKLHKNQSAVIFPIGVGGAGKSQLVVEWVDRYRTFYGIVAWIRAESIKTLCLDLTVLAETLKISRKPEDSSYDIAKKIVEELSIRPLRERNVLLVYDNAEAYTQISEFIPRRGSFCHSIITTRNRKGCSVSATIGVGPLDPNSSLRVVQHLVGRKLKKTEKKEIVPVMIGFGYLPLAIVMFAHLIKSEGTGRAIELVQRHTIKILESEIELDEAYGGKGRESVWSICCLQIEKQSRERENGLSGAALRLLTCLSFLGAENVPKQMLMDFMSDDIELFKATRELASRSLILENTEDGSVSTHRLIQFTARASVDKSEYRELLDSIGEALLKSPNAMVFPHLKALTDHWKSYGNPSSETLGVLKYLLGILLSIDSDFFNAIEELNESFVIQRGFATEVLSNIANMYSALGCDECCLIKFQELLELSRLLTDHEYLAKALDGLGDAYKAQRNYERAHANYEELLQIKRTIFGNDHPEIASTLNKISEVYTDQGQFQRAQSTFEESLQIARAASSSDDTWETKRMIGDLYIKKSQFDLALVEYEQSLQFCREKIDGDIDVSRLLVKIGQVKFKKGQYGQALDDYGESIRIMRNTFGNEHFEVAFLLSCIGDVYSRQGSFECALINYEESLQLSRSLYDHHDITIADLLGKIGDMNKELRKYELSLANYEEARQVFQVVCGHDHPVVGETLLWIGLLYDTQGEHERALTFFEEALRIIRAAHRDEHPRTAIALRIMGTTKRSQHQYDSALKNYEESLRILRVAYGNDHEEVAKTLNAIGTLYLEQNQYEHALTQYQESLRVHRIALGHGHEEVACALEKIGDTYKEQGQWKRALSNYNEALQIKRAAHGNDHPEVAATLHLLGGLFHEQHQYEQALTQYEESLRVYQVEFGNDHPKVALVLLEIGRLHKEQGHWNRALAKYEKALEIERTVYGDDHPKVAATLHLVGKLFYAQHKYEQALTHYERTLQIRRTMYGNDHPLIANTLNSVGKVFYAQHQYDRALTQYERSLQIYRSTYCNETLSVAITLGHIGDVHQAQEDYHKALGIYEESLRIKRVSVGIDHRINAITFNCIGNVYKAQGKNERALLNYRKALRILRTFFEDGIHPEDQTFSNNIVATEAKIAGYPSVATRRKRL